MFRLPIPYLARKTAISEVSGRGRMKAFLTPDRGREHEIRLIKKFLASGDDGISARLFHESPDEDGQRWRRHRDESKLFADGNMAGRIASISDILIRSNGRPFRWLQGLRLRTSPEHTELCR